MRVITDKGKPRSVPARYAEADRYIRIARVMVLVVGALYAIFIGIAYPIATMSIGTFSILVLGIALLGALLSLVIAGAVYGLLTGVLALFDMVAELTEMRRAQAAAETTARP